MLIYQLKFSFISNRFRDNSTNVNMFNDKIIITTILPDFSYDDKLFEDAYSNMRKQIVYLGGWNANHPSFILIQNSNVKNPYMSLYLE